MSTLNDAQLNSLRQLLSSERTRLRGEIREHLLTTDREQYSELAGQVHDAGEESVADLLTDVNVAVMGRLIIELREAEAALERISTGGYGRCEDCGIDIPYARLQAYPAARRCIEHQALHEKTYADEGKPSL
ncbi:MAG: conjugal transfer protein TraR [Gammaproteobacteria bacterium HGW-Gammaproteobacteria-1]|jgi:RNA polymerase-binding transcription factor DksA|nr:MAG: conjugal transfer protein TraR [Gammaproteobacteria bacterium HGW-Gammaproteobacteria-1]